MGTENGIMENMQQFLRLEHNDSYASNCFIYGASTHNQRIESWWAFLRKNHCQFWMNTFQELKDEDEFIGDFLDKLLILFTCLNITELLEGKIISDMYQSRQCKRAEHNAYNGGLIRATKLCSCCLCQLMADHFLHAPSTPSEAIELYLFLRSSIRKDL
ncbi:hypothetical protein WMY93_000693 [Mugilogobius chulae]|uniref:Uncharacterized protein n=1 Tax=Mugilogobius chulae TaxID=88201 RepID=A0AAW0QAS1_9GOBI